MKMNSTEQSSALCSGSEISNSAGDIRSDSAATEDDSPL